MKEHSAMISKAGFTLALIVGMFLIVAAGCGESSLDPTPVPSQEAADPTPQTDAPEGSDDVANPIRALLDVHSRRTLLEKSLASRWRV
jgi:hypothetical protein